MSQPAKTTEFRADCGCRLICVGRSVQTTERCRLHREFPRQATELSKLAKSLMSLACVNYPEEARGRIAEHIQRVEKKTADVKKLFKEYLEMIDNLPVTGQVMEEEAQ